MNGIGRNLVEIASLFIGLAMITVIVKNSSGTAEVINAGSGGFNTILGTAMGGSGYNF